VHSVRAPLSSVKLVKRQAPTDGGMRGGGHAGRIRNLALRDAARGRRFEGSVCLVAVLDDLGYCFFPWTLRVFLKICLHLFLKVGKPQGKGPADLFAF
jgi:hypothetical protein